MPAKPTSREKTRKPGARNALKRGHLCFELPGQLEANAEGAEGGKGVWVETIPKGPRIEGKDGRWYMLSDPGALVARLNKRIERLGPHGELMFDYDHESEGWSGETEASGWGTRHRVAANGAVETLVEFVPEAQQQIANKVRRFLSPVFWVDSQREIVDLSSVALLNKANLLMPALNRAEDDDHQVEDEDGDEPEENGTMKTLLKKLNVAETASEAEALVALNTMLETASQPNLKDFVPRAEFDAQKNRADSAEKQLKDRVVAEKNAAIESEVQAAIDAGKITPATKDYFVKSAQRSEEGLADFREFVKNAATVVTEANITDRKPPTSEQGSKQLNAEEQKVARAFGITDEEFIKRRDAA